MTSVLVVRNLAQKLGKTIVSVSTPTITGSRITIYTTPAGKTARIIGRMVCSTTGAGNVADLLFRGLSIAEWQATGGVFDPNVPQDLAEGTQVTFDEVLEAAELVELAQDAGTNANFIGCLEIEERPA